MSSSENFEKTLHMNKEVLNNTSSKYECTSIFWNVHVFCLVPVNKYLFGSAFNSVDDTTVMVNSACETAFSL